MGLGTSKPGAPGTTTPSRVGGLRSYFSPPTSPPETPDSSPPHSPRSPNRGGSVTPDSRAPNRRTTQPTPISSTQSRPMPVPLSPFSGVNMCVSPSGPVPTGQERVATVFTWTHGGKSVAVTGTWANWQEVFPLNRSEHDFTTILELPPGVHQYKFIVDGKWKHAPEQAVATDSRGNLNNCMEIKEFRLGQSGKNNPLSRGSPPGSYTQDIPDLIKFNDVFDEPQDVAGPAGGGQKKKPDEPPVLPPHLLGTRAVLNTTTDDPTVLPLPNHVMLNHLYFKKYEDPLSKRDVLILGTTQRYREKFVTTVFYRPAPSLSDVNNTSTTSASGVAPPNINAAAVLASRESTATHSSASEGEPIGGSGKSVARQLVFSPRDSSSTTPSVQSPLSSTSTPLPSTLPTQNETLTRTNHPTTALTMDRGSSIGPSEGTTARDPLVATKPINIIARRRLSVTGDGTVLCRSPVQEEGDDIAYADYSLRHNMG